jgi:hypothetical protein
MKAANFEVTPGKLFSVEKKRRNFSGQFLKAPARKPNRVFGWAPH